MASSIIREDWSNRIPFKLIYGENYTAGTANTWIKTSTNCSIPYTGLYRIRASFANAGVYGLGYSENNVTNVNAMYVLEEHTLSASIDNVFFLPAGSWAFWTKCSQTGGRNSLMIWLLYRLE